jgi:structural maintenance of chromosome 4
MGDTLVAKDLQQAQRIAYGKQKRFRVVTLAGQVIDVSGTMSGGGSRPQKGGMSSAFSGALVTPEQLQNLNQEKEKLEQLLSNLKVNLSQTLKDKQSISQQILKLETKMSKEEMAIQAIVTEINDLEGHIQGLQIQQKQPKKEEKKELEQLQKQSQLLEKDLSDLQSKASKIEQEIKDLQEQILEMGGVQFRTQKAVVDGIQEQLSTHQERTSKLKVERTTREKNLKKSEKAIEQKNQELSDLENELLKIQKEFDTKEVAAKDLKERVREAKNILIEKEEYINQLKVTLNEKNEILNNSKSKQIELQAQLSESNQLLSKKTKQKQQLEALIKDLSLQKTGFEEDEKDMELTLETFTTPEAFEAIDCEQVSKEIAKLECMFS